MHNVLEYLKTNAYWLIPVVVVVLTNIANGLTNHPETKGILLAISKVIDQLPTTILAKKSAPNQTFKLPLAASNWPADHPLNPDATVSGDDKTSKGPKSVLPMLFWWVTIATLGSGAFGITSAALTACGANAKAIAIDVAVACGVPGVKDAVAKLVPTVLSILLNGGADWQTQLDGLANPEAGVGADVVVCAVQRTISDIESGIPKGAAMPPDRARAVARGRIYLGLHARVK